MITPFTPELAAAGGVLIGLAAVLTMALLGRIAGISGIMGGLLRPKRGDLGWRVAFLVGLAAAPLLHLGLFGAWPTVRISTPTGVLIVAGILVGLGTRLGAGCTSGHGVCGIARLSVRSVMATVIFMGAALVTVFLVRHAAEMF